MDRLFLFVAALTLLAPSASPWAQAGGTPADVRYCGALSQLYMRYVGNPETEPRGIRRNDAEAEDAMTQCRRGNPAPAIPVLERKLTGNRITLPPRE
jgi:hypothetical protein